VELRLYVFGLNSGLNTVVPAFRSSIGKLGGEMQDVLAFDVQPGVYF